MTTIIPTARSTAPQRSAARLISLLLFISSLLIIGSAAPASASLKYRSLPAFGPVATPSNLAVNQTSGNVYVAATSENSVNIFEPKGSTAYELAGKLTGSETPQGAFAMPTTEPAPVAIDSASGDLYVADPGHRVVDKFDATGKYVCQFSGLGRGCHANPEVEVGGPSTFGELTGVTTDAHENVYVSDYSNEVVDEFTATGTDVKQIAGCGIGHPSGLAFDSSEALYVQNYFSNVVNCTTETVLDPNQSFDVAVDPLTNDVYVDHGSSVSVYGPGPTNPQLDVFNVAGAGSEGVAINGSARRVYVTDKAEGNVLVFEPLIVPDVRLTPPVSEIGPSSATLHGEINPDETSGASYYFEYGTTTEYGSFSPAPPGTSAGEGNAFVPASTELTGLQPGVSYHYRLVGTNDSGLTNASEDGTFTTANVAPEVLEAEARQITTDSVLFRGSVNPENLATSYHFEYGETESYGQSLPEIDIGASGEPVEALQASPAGLKPGTTYHFTLVARNASGTTKSPDQTFKTLSTATPPNTPPAVETGAAAVLGLSEATIAATVDPMGLPTTWVLELGTAPGSYETRVFGNLAGEPGTAAPSASFTDLQPGTTYHYRVVASNAAGTSEGLDRTFTTPPLGPVITQPLAPPLLPLPVFPPVKEPPIHHPRKHHKHHKHHPAKKHKKATKSRR